MNRVELKTKCNTSFWVSPEDEHLVKNMKWYKHKSYKDHFYIRGFIKYKQHVYLHRFLTGCPEGMTVDHIDRNPMNNCRDNLRICTLKENLKNTKRSPSRGYYFDTHFNKYRAEIMFKGRIIRSKRFLTEQEAIDASCELKKKYREK